MVFTVKVVEDALWDGWVRGLRLSRNRRNGGRGGDGRGWMVATESEQTEQMRARGLNVSVLAAVPLSTPALRCSTSLCIPWH